jgi:hypothetical protein
MGGGHVARAMSELPLGCPPAKCLPVLGAVQSSTYPTHAKIVGSVLRDFLNNLSDTLPAINKWDFRIVT